MPFIGKLRSKREDKITLFNFNITYDKDSSAYVWSL